MHDALPSVLCVDDDPEVLEQLKEHLSLHGFIVLTATNGVEACLQVKRWSPRALVLDLFIPRLGGIGTLTRVRAMSPDIAVVLMSHVPSALDLVVEAGLNVSAALPKPVAPERVVAALAAAGVTPPVMLSSQADAPGGRTRILLVDDEPRFLEMIGEYLGARGLAVATAPSGEKALDRMADFRPDLVLLDLLMPGMGGMEALRRMRAGFPDSRVIMVTAMEDLDTARKALAAGAADYLTKPFTLDYLDSVLAVYAPQRGEPAGARAVSRA